MLIELPFGAREERRAERQSCLPCVSVPVR